MAVIKKYIDAINFTGNNWSKGTNVRIIIKIIFPKIYIL